MKRNKQKSFIVSTIRLNLISLLILVCLCFVVAILIWKNFNRILPNLDYIVTNNIDNLTNDKYEKIKIDNKDAAFVIYDENDNVLYKYHENLISNITAEDKYFINEINSDELFQVHEVENETDEVKYYISKVRLDSNSGKSSSKYSSKYISKYLNKYNVINYAKLNKDLEIIQGDLFPSKNKITKFQLGLLSNADNNMYEKYTYENKNGEIRVLIFMSSNITSTKYLNAVYKANSLWFILIPTIIIILFFVALYCKKKLEKTIEPLNEIVGLYDQNKKIKTVDKNIAKEFKPVVDSYIKIIDENRKHEEDKNLMIASISHDIKTPLTAIKGYTRAFKDDLVSLDKKDEYMDSIIHKVDITNDLIDKLFDFTSLEYDDYKLKLEKIDINNFTRDYLNKKRIDFKTNEFILQEEIPNSKLICEIDRLLFIRVYDNLLQNIFKYNDKNTKVLFKINEEKDKIKIVVADNGKGIPDNIRNGVFKPFITENEARVLEKGIGLGLPTVKQIIKLHKGNVKLSEKPIKGYVTEFIIEIPIKSLKKS